MALRRIRDVARPVLQEMKTILATPIVLQLPQQVLGLLQRMEDSRERYVRDAYDGYQEAEPGCLARQRWLGLTWIMVKETLVFWLSISLKIRFRLLFVSLEWIYYCEYLK